MEGNRDAEAYRQTYLEDRCELSGLSESEHIGGLENILFQRPSHPKFGEGNMFHRKLTETRKHFGGVVVEA
jgi:hypothetical protein